MSKAFPKASHTRFLVATFIFLVATCSFFGNSFSAADSTWFTQHQLDSEQLVLDGILHSRESNHGKPIVLGRYTRPEIPEQYSLAHRQAISNIFLVPTLFCFVLIQLLCGYEDITEIDLSSLLAFISISR